MPPVRGSHSLRSDSRCSTSTRSATSGEADGRNTFDVIIDRGTASEIRKSVSIVDAGVYYPHSYFIVDGLAAATHTVEIERTNTGPVRIQGVTYIGVP